MSNLTWNEVSRVVTTPYGVDTNFIFGDMAFLNGKWYGFYYSDSPGATNAPIYIFSTSDGLSYTKNSTMMYVNRIHGYYGSNTNFYPNSSRFLLHVNGGGLFVGNIEENNVVKVFSTTGPGSEEDDAINTQEVDALTSDGYFYTRIWQHSYAMLLPLTKESNQNTLQIFYIQNPIYSIAPYGDEGIASLNSGSFSVGSGIRAYVSMDYYASREYFELNPDFGINVFPKVRLDYLDTYKVGSTTYIRPPGKLYNIGNIYNFIYQDEDDKTRLYTATLSKEPPTMLSEYADPNLEGMTYQTQMILDKESKTYIFVFPKNGSLYYVIKSGAKTFSARLIDSLGTYSFVHVSPQIHNDQFFVGAKYGSELHKPVILYGQLVNIIDFISIPVISNYEAKEKDITIEIDEIAIGSDLVREYEIYMENNGYYSLYSTSIERNIELKDVGIGTFNFLVIAKGETLESEPSDTFSVTTYYAEQPEAQINFSPSICAGAVSHAIFDTFSTDDTKDEENEIEFRMWGHGLNKISEPTERVLRLKNTESLTATNTEPLETEVFNVGSESSRWKKINSEESKSDEETLGILRLWSGV